VWSSAVFSGYLLLAGLQNAWERLDEQLVVFDVDVVVVVVVVRSAYQRLFSLQSLIFFFFFYLNGLSSPAYARSELPDSEVRTLQTVGMTPWTGDQPIARPLLNAGKHRHNKCGQTTVPHVGFESTIPIFERAKIFHALDLVATVNGSHVCS
jgi:hypothetical protein